MTQLNQNLSEFYSQLPNKMNWAVKIARECKRSVNCVRTWGLGHGGTKDDKCLEVLHRTTKIPKEQLFSHLTE